jgi:hypothetical protein
MQLQELLMSNASIAEGGVRATSERGCSVIDVPAFIAKVRSVDCVFAVVL